MTIARHEGGDLTARMEYARTLSASALLPEAYRGHPENVLIAVEYGQALGIPAIQALNGIVVIKGRPTASADLIASLVRRAGHKLRITEGTDPDGPTVTASLIRADDPEFAFTAIWTLAKARTAGLLQSQTWKSYPGQMLRARAITEVCRQGASDALFGVVYTPEELGGDERHEAPAYEPPPPRVVQTTRLADALDVLDVEPETGPTMADIATEIDTDVLRGWYRQADDETRALITARVQDLHDGRTPDA